MTPDEEAALLPLLTDELRDGVEAGRLRITGPGWKPEKPVVVDAVTGHWVEGSGRPAGANDPAVVGKVHGFKHSKSYQETLDLLVPPRREDNAQAIVTLEELLVAAKAMVVGEATFDLVMCPCGCEHTFNTQVGVKRDAKVLTFLIERIVGQAAKKTDVNIHSEELITMISDSRVLTQIEVISLTPEDRAARARAIAEAN